MKYLLAIMMLCACTLVQGAGQRSSGNVRTDGFAQGIRGTAAILDPDPTASTNLVAWWTFASGDGSYQADMSGNGNYLTQETASAYATISNSSAYFGGGDWLRTPTTSFMNGATQYTITAWINLYSITDYSGFVATRGTAFSGLCADSWATRKMVTYHNTGGDATIAVYPSNTWVFIAMSQNNGNTTGRISTINSTNKVFTTTGNTALTVDDYWTIGREDAGSRWITSGFMDDIRFYNRNLSSNELLSVQAEGRR